MELNDRVIVHIQSAPYMRVRFSIGKIIGETKTAWRVEYGDNLGRPKDLFRKTDLHLKGAGQFSCTRIKEWNDEEWRVYQRELLKRTVCKALSDFKWEELDTDLLVKIHKEACEAKREKERKEREIA